MDGHLEVLNNVEHYTIGWIAALSIELAAAIAMLDEEHGEPKNFIQHSQDTNIYTWGRMCEHNIVITSLAAGAYGTVSASTTASCMLSSFPSIRIGLLVGIGGGIARPERGYDLRLGDIAVSQPTQDNGGVIQYDLFKAEVDGRRRNRAFLNRPPDLLLKALTKIQAVHERKPSRIPEFLAEMVADNPKMARAEHGYVHQGCENDRLFNDTDPSEEIKRRARDSTNPEIHYGTIASGNTLFKDGVYRNRILDEIGQDCICFEMEAAGLMNAFPSIVIRGICDYADSRKNDRWQRYAAATAAAYAKELLIYVPSKDLQSEKRAIDIKEVSDNLSRIHSTVTETRTAVHDMNLRIQAKEVLKWLSSIDASTNLNEGLRKRKKGSGQWFIDSSLFKEWMDGSRRHIWMYGIPGCGKTVLISTIIDHIHLVQRSQPLRHVLYFFFDFSSNEKRKLDQAVRCLAAQLYSKCSNSRQELEQLYSSCDDGRRQPSFESLNDTFSCMLRHSEEIRIIFDALDESNTRNDLVRWLEDTASSEHSGLQLLLTSRQEDDIQSELEIWMHPRNMVHLSKDSINCDIRAYIKQQLQKESHFKRWRSVVSVQEDIESEIMSKVDGMFRLAACQLDMLGKCLDLQMLRRSLSTLPKTLEVMYARILAEIDETYRQHAIRLLQFLVYSDRPLSIQEVVDVIAVDLNREPSFEPNLRMPEHRDVLRICPGLLAFVNRVLDKDETHMKFKKKKSSEATITEVHLAHFSVQQYLTSGSIDSTFPKREAEVGGVFQKALEELSAHTSIARVCLAYLLCLTSQDYTSHRKEMRAIESKFPLAAYAAKHGMFSAELLEENDEICNTILSLLAQASPHYPTLCKVICGYSFADFPVYIASKLGLRRILRALIHRGADLSGERPLEAACLGNQYETAKILLDNGAVIGPSMLSAACYRGHTKIVELLLDNGAELADHNGFNTPLMSASGAGHPHIVKLLLERGDDPNQSALHRPPLVVACEHNNPSVVRVLLDNGAEPNGLDDFHRPLVSASGLGHARIVKLLLERGADPNQRDSRGTPLVVACEHDYPSVVQTLLDNGAEPNTLDDDLYGTALAVAVKGDHLDIVKLLINHRADVNICGGKAGTALQIAVSQPYDTTPMVRLLLESGADVNVEGGEHGSALTAAVFTRKRDTVELLISHGANVNSPGGDHWRSPLHVARYWGICQDIEQLLLENGAEDIPLFNAEMVDSDEDSSSSPSFGTGRSWRGYYSDEFEPRTRVPSYLRSASDRLIPFPPYETTRDYSRFSLSSESIISLDSSTSSDDSI